MPSDNATSGPSRQTLAGARALRDEYARTAALYAYRIETAPGTAPTGAVARWMTQYRRSAASCRVLGQIVRGEREAR